PTTEHVLTKVRGCWGWAGAGVIVSAMVHQDRLVGRTLRLGCGGLACVLITIAGATESHAQATGGGLQIFSSAPTPVAATIEQTKLPGDAQPTRTADGKFAYLGWLWSAGTGFGGKYDSNVNASAINPRSVYGANFQPTFTAERITGIQNTT